VATKAERCLLLSVRGLHRPNKLPDRPRLFHALPERNEVLGLPPCLARWYNRNTLRQLRAHGQGAFEQRQHALQQPRGRGV
jgi:hypothetical protein